MTGWRSERGRHLLQTESGTLSARRVIWATHTDLRELTPLGRRYLTLHTYAGVTPPLPDAVLGEGRLAQWGVLPALRAGSTEAIGIPTRRLAAMRLYLASTSPARLSVLRGAGIAVFQGGVDVKISKG